MLCNFSTVYPKGHPLAGQPTEFIEQITVTRRKKHTLRDSAERWEKARERNATPPMHIYTGARTGNAVRHGLELYKGCQRVDIWRTKNQTPGDMPAIVVDGRQLRLEEAANFIANDGFYTPQAFEAWFFLGVPDDVPFVTKYCLHWTDLRY